MPVFLFFGGVHPSVLDKLNGDGYLKHSSKKVKDRLALEANSVSYKRHPLCKLGDQ